MIGMIRPFKALFKGSYLFLKAFLKGKYREIYGNIGMTVKNLKKALSLHVHVIL